MYSKTGSRVDCVSVEGARDLAKRVNASEHCNEHCDVGLHASGHELLNFVILFIYLSIYSSIYLFIREARGTCSTPVLSFRDRLNLTHFPLSCFYRYQMQNITFWIGRASSHIAQAQQVQIASGTQRSFVALQGFISEGKAFGKTFSIKWKKV